jgi:hypothetical protein
VQPEDQQDVQECLGARTGQAQPGDAGAVVMDDGSQAERRTLAPGLRRDPRVGAAVGPAALAGRNNESFSCTDR